MLDIECFTYLNRALESVLSPIVIFATNRGTCEVRGTGMTSPHGIPIDLLDKLVIIRTELYSTEEIVKIRADVEGIQLNDESINYLGNVGNETSLRHAVQILTPAAMIAKSNLRSDVILSDVQETCALFHDAKFSANLLVEQADKYIS